MEVKAIALPIIWIVGSITAMLSILIPFVIYKFGLATKKWIKDKYYDKLEVYKELEKYISTDNCKMHQGFIKEIIDRQSSDIREIKEGVNKLTEIALNHFKDK